MKFSLIGGPADGHIVEHDPPYPPELRVPGKNHLVAIDFELKPELMDSKIQTERYLLRRDVITTELFYVHESIKRLP